ncbi:MAG: hypothetical protein ACRCST_13530 [Turicibacter sp.]
MSLQLKSLLKDNEHFTIIQMKDTLIEFQFLQFHAFIKFPFPVTDKGLDHNLSAIVKHMRSNTGWWVEKIKPAGKYAVNEGNITVIATLID